MAGLRTALAAVEEELAHARDQATIRLQARHNSDPERHPDDRELDLYELQVTLEQILPRVFRGGFILTLWSVFEVVSKRMANYAADQLKVVIAASEWKRKGANFLEILESVYSRKLGVSAFPDPNERKQLDQLRELRNALIHHNGSVNGLPVGMRAGGPAIYATIGLDHYKDLHEEFVIPNADFIRRHFAVVDKYLMSLAERAYEAAHPPAIKAGDPP